MNYPGGKNGSGVYQAIINQMPPHRVYIEAFLGSGAILRNKKPAVTSIGIDIDAGVIDNFGDVDHNVKLIQADAVEWLASSSVTGDTLIYLDPPYLMDVRSCQRQIYRCEFSGQAQHRELLAVIKRLPCMVMISGYWSELYEQELLGWRTVHFNAMTHGGQAVEWLWLNFPRPVELHDYQYLGRDFRERERIKRKRERWKSRLLGMPDLERQAVLAAVDEIRAAGAANDGDAS